MTGNTATTPAATSPTREPRRYGKGGKRIRPAAGNVSSPCWAAPPPTAPRSAPPASPAPPASTAASSTGTATCSTRSTPSRPPHRHAADTPGPAVTRASLQADLLAAGERAQRLQRPGPATGKAPVRSTRRKGLAGIRSRRSRGHRRPQPDHQPPRTAGHRPAPATRRTRPGPRRRTRREPRTHRPTQHRDTTPITRRTTFLHNTCRAR